MATKGQPFKSTSKGSGAQQAITVWAIRQKRQGVDWKEVDVLSLKGALITALAAGGALMISGAAGGIGVGLTLFLGEGRAKEYAATTEELNQLLEQIIDYCSSPAEDVRETLRASIEPGARVE